MRAEQIKGETAIMVALLSGHADLGEDNQTGEWCALKWGKHANEPEFNCPLCNLPIRPSDGLLVHASRHLRALGDIYHSFRALLSLRAQVERNKMGILLFNSQVIDIGEEVFGVKLGTRDAVQFWHARGGQT